MPSNQSFIWEITSSLIENPAELDVWIFTVVMCLMSISLMLSSSFIRYSPLLPVHLSIFVNCEMLQTSVIVILGEARYWKHILGMLSTSLWSLEWLRKKHKKKKLYKIGFSHAYSTVYALTVGSYPVPIQVAACLEWKSHRIRHKNTKGCIVVDVLLQVLVWKSSFSNRPMSLKAYLKPKHCTAVYNSLWQILDNFVLLLVWNQL